MTAAPGVPVATEQVQTFCPLCVSKCGAIATITDGEFVALSPDPSHPTGQALCVKGKAAPDLARHPDRLLHPLRRTNPRDATDPGWEEISWDQALGTVAEKLNQIKTEHGAHAVAFGSSSPSCTAINDSDSWITRLRRAFGTPNHTSYVELCGWGRYLASIYTFGASIPGVYLPDLDNAGCILFWGYNPSVARLDHATKTIDALRRGAKLVTVDPRRAGLSTRADHWLRVRPGTDAALALAFIHVMIDRGWFDESFVARWTTGPALVREDTGRLLRPEEVGIDTDDEQALVCWDGENGAPVALAVGEGPKHLRGSQVVDTADGPVRCSTAFELLARRSAEYADPEPITGVPVDQVAEAARTLWHERPVAFYTWSGLEQQSNATQTIRAINILYALTGSLDGPGGNVLFTSVPANDVKGMELPDPDTEAVGVGDRPLGPGAFEVPTGEDVFTAMLDGRPYPIRALVNFGANFVMAHGDSARVRDALAKLDFFVHADLFLSPTAELADIVLPVAGAFEVEGLRLGFETSQAAQSRIQLRRPVAARRGEARSDLEIVFALADRLGLGEHFFDGDLDAGWSHQLEPSGVTLEQLRAEPGGVSLPLETQHRKYASGNGQPAGFRTPTGRVELYSEDFAANGYDPLPVHVPPTIGPESRPELAKDFPLTLTCAKSLRFCETQHRQVAKLRKGHLDPELEIHPETAADRRIGKGDWVVIDTPFGSVKARAKLDTNLDPGVVVGQHGFWQGCAELDIPPASPFEDGGLNLNLVLRQGPSDPVSGSSPLRTSMCQVSLAE